MSSLETGTLNKSLLALVVVSVFYDIFTINTHEVVGS